MTRIREIYDVIDGAAPFETAMTFDNVGLLVGDLDREVRRVILALDITPAVVEEAASLNADLILSHHPVIFHPVKRLGTQDVPYLLAEKGIAALCCHTNLDASPVIGVNVALGKAIGLLNVKAEPVFGEEAVLFSGECGAPMEAEEFARMVMIHLNAKGLRVMPGDRPIRKVFLCSGAGGEYAPLAAQRGADAYLTGEMSHHEALDVAGTGMTCLAAGHYETEKPFGEFLASYLKKRFPEVAFLQSKRERNPFSIF